MTAALRAPEAGEGERSALLAHLEELRGRVVTSAIAIALCAIPCGIWWQKILDLLLIWPLRYCNPAPHIIYTGPADAVVLSLRIALFGGLFCAMPVVLYQFWGFIAPGLYRNERAVVLPTVFASTVFFVAGVLFCYFTLPFVMGVMAQYAGGRMDPYFRVDEYFTFLLTLCVAFGAVFELPVAAFVLARLGLITAGLLWKKIRYAIVLIFILAAVLTPPDIISQTALALPLMLLYLLSIGVAYVAGRRKA